MACRTKHVNKKTGITYIYESESYWDKEKKQPRNKKVCIGKLDPESGEFIPSKRLASEKSTTINPAITASAEIVGPSMVLDTITESLGLKKLLKSCFPQWYQQIITMAYYLVSQGGALSHCEVWCKGHAAHLKDSLASQRISNILRSISIDEKQTFFKKWISKTLENDYLCYDITSISSYAELNEYIKYGHNRDKEKLPQLNFAALFSQKGRLPVYFQRLPGNITDVTTLHNLLKTFKSLGKKMFHSVMDKGFYSKKNVDELTLSRIKFILSVPLNNKWVQHAIDDVYEIIDGPEGYRKVDGKPIYVHSSLYSWGKEKRRCYLHLYYNEHKKAAAKQQFLEQLLDYKEELESGKLIKDHQDAYDKFFIVKTTPKRGMKVTYNATSVSKHIKRYVGFQALITNSIKDPMEALKIYRDKDMVEKSFDDLKNQLDMKRLRMHNSATVDGRLFVQFIALIYMSALRNEMRSSGLTKKYTVRELLQEMETLTKVKYSGKYGHILTEPTKQQREILTALKIPLPNDT